MYATLSPGAIGVHVNSLEDGIAAAKTGGFAGLEVNIGEAASLIDAQGVDAVRQLFIEGGIIPAVFGLPTDWRGDEERWKQDLEALPRLASAARALGITRTATWFLPFSDERPYDENRKFYIERFRPIAAILADHGISLGLEFVGPKTLRDGHKYEFIYKLEETLELGEEIGPNLGLLLDCYHWYTSHSTLDSLKNLRPEQVVYVHVNDAPAGVAIDEQQDGVRCLPGETGVIDIAGFLGTLKQIGYNGPVAPEPFKKELGSLPSDEARLETVGQSMRKIFSIAGV